MKHDHKVPPTKEQIIACLDLASERAKRRSHKLWVGLDEEGTFKKEINRLWTAKKKREVTNCIFWLK